MFETRELQIEEERTSYYQVHYKSHCILDFTMEMVFPDYKTNKWRLMLFFCFN